MLGRSTRSSYADSEAAPEDGEEEEAEGGAAGVALCFREINAREEMRVRGRRLKAGAQDTYESRLSTGWESGGALFKEGITNRPRRNLTWILGINAKFESGGFEVP